MRLVQAGIVVIVCIALAGCSDRGLRKFTTPGEGPDEFLISPGKALEAPDSLTELPAPTPGGTNITDQQPVADAVAALGGRATGSELGAVPGGDGALVNHASRFGRDGTIRQQLADEDAAFRRRQGRLSGFRLIRTDRYKEVYQRQALNAQREQQRWRAAGARTPSAPPVGQ